MSEHCMMHNLSEQVPAVYEMALPIGNVIPLCAPCCAWWRLDARQRPEDKSVQPIWIRDLTDRLVDGTVVPTV